MINKISLKDIKIYAFHGVMPEENTIGSYYNINISLYLNFIHACRTDDINFTIDYSEVNDIIHSEMKINSKLLEAIAFRIIKKIFSTYKKIDKIDLKIEKTNPPIMGDVLSSVVEISTIREEINTLE